MATRTLPVSSFYYTLFASRTSAPFWLLVRLYVGYEWLIAGWEKFTNPVWFGPNAGPAITGFMKGALAKTAGVHPDVQMWYASFIEQAVLPHANLWSYAITLGELAVGAGLILGILTGVAAFFGGLMNLNFLLAGTVSINPVLLILQIGLMLAWRIAGDWGGDRIVLPRLSKACRTYLGRG